MQLLGKLGQMGCLMWRAAENRDMTDESKRRSKGCLLLTKNERRAVWGSLRKLKASHGWSIWLVHCSCVKLGQGQRESVTVLWFQSNFWWGTWFCWWTLTFTVIFEVRFLFIEHRDMSCFSYRSDQTAAAF